MSSPTRPTPSQVQETLDRMQAFTERLLAENARLRRSLATTHASTLGGREGAGSAAGARERELRTEIERLTLALSDARAAGSAAGPAAMTAGGSLARPAEDEQAGEARRALAELTVRHAELEEQNNNLANLYVASYQLHSTLDFREVIGTVMEIVINLIGAEAFCILLLDSKSDELTAITAEGMGKRPTARVRVGDGLIGQAAKTGEAYFRPASDSGDSDFLHPIAAVPLKIKEQVIGVITVHRLFPQKQAFASVDFDLFNLLAGHAATAIFSAKLYGESERKLTTIQSFLDLLTAS